VSKKQKVKFDAQTRHLIGRLWDESIRQYRWVVALTIYFMVLAASGEAMTIKMLQPIIDKIFVEHRHDMLVPISVLILTIFLVKSIASYGQDCLIQLIGLRIVCDMQRRFFDHLSIMDHNFFHKNPSGSLVSRFTVDTVMMKNAVSSSLTNLFKDTLSVVFLVILMFMQDVKLAAIILFIFPIAFYPIIYLGRKMRKVTANTQQHMGFLTTILEQIFQGISVVKSYAMEKYEQSRVNETVETIFKLNYKASRTRSASSPIMEFLGGVAIVVVVTYGGTRVMSGETTPGTFFAFLGALITAYRPMKSIAKLNLNVQEGLAGAQRLYEIIDTPTQIEDAPNAKALELKDSNIKFEDVTFCYDDGTEAISDMSFNINSGTTCALVGPSGAGKSTVLSLLLRFYDCSKGSILIDGQDIRELTLESLRKNISLVSQDVTLFDNSVRNNILYGKPDASEEEVIEAAKTAAAHDFIMELPEGYDTIVGERGMKLSGGQRQRLSIARAMLKNAPILLLDEATSALDTESERKVQAAIDALMKNRTTLAIAHRLSTIINADVIHVIDKGRLVESGTHEELLAKNGAYAKLYQLQFNKQEN